MVPISTHVRTTDALLLLRVRDWRDSQAWTRFMSQYEPHLRAVCRVYGLVGDAADECCQEVWSKLATAMRRFLMTRATGSAVGCTSSSIAGSGTSSSIPRTNALKR